VACRQNHANPVRVPRLAFHRYGKSISLCALLKEYLFSRHKWKPLVLLLQPSFVALHQPAELGAHQLDVPIRLFGFFIRLLFFAASDTPRESI